MIRRPPRSTLDRSSAASDVYKRQPYEHSEDIADQDLAVRLMQERMADPDLALHARVHREMIARYGRFPLRNAALGRENTAEESVFLADGGYGALLRALKG